MSTQSAKSQNVIEMYELLLVAGRRRQRVAGIYDGLPDCCALMFLGWKQSHLHALVYQVRGDSDSGLPVTLETAGVWRCLARKSAMSNYVQEWRTELRSSRQTCIDEVDFDVDAQPGADPQNGQ